MRSLFSLNKKQKELVFYTNSSSANTFSPYTSRTLTRRSHWDLGEGDSYVTGPSLTKNYSDSGITKQVRMLGNSFSDIEAIDFSNDNLVGDFIIGNDFDTLNTITLSTNPGLTGLTINSSFPFGMLLNGCGFSGNMDLTGAKIRIQFRANANSLTSITHSYSNESISVYYIQDNNIIGSHNLTHFPNFSGFFQIQNNSNLTEIIHTASTQEFYTYNASSCNLMGNHDMSMISGLGGQFIIYNNLNLTGITHTPSSKIFSAYYAFSCNIIGNHNLTSFSGLGGIFNMTSNANLTGITHTASTTAFSSYQAASCKLTGNLDLSMLSNLGGDISLTNNNRLTGVTFPINSTERAYAIGLQSSDIQGEIILSGFSSMGSSLSGNSGYFRCNGNSGLTSVIFAESTGFFRNDNDNYYNSAFGMYDCSLGYVDFNPISGTTLISGVTWGIPRFELWGNSMTAADVNHILSDFDSISNLNYSGWTATSGTTGGFLSISGNTAPDSTAGGYNGIVAKANLIAKGWSVITD